MENSDFLGKAISDRPTHTYEFKLRGYVDVNEAVNADVTFELEHTLDCGIDHPVTIDGIQSDSVTI